MNSIYVRFDFHDRSEVRMEFSHYKKWKLLIVNDLAPNMLGILAMVPVITLPYVTEICVGYP